MMVMKGDTLVYNAAVFQLSEGSMLDQLVRQLPGVELRDGGRIYVNGRYANSVDFVSEAGAPATPAPRAAAPTLRPSTAWTSITV